MSAICAALLCGCSVIRIDIRKVRDLPYTVVDEYDVPEEMREFVDYFDVLMGQPFSLRTNCAVGSFGDTLSINFTSTIIETDVERFFFRKLVQEGLHVKIETNRDMNRSEF